jgi:hypothetical protein
MRAAAVIPGRKDFARLQETPDLERRSDVLLGPEPPRGAQVWHENVVNVVISLVAKPA